MQVRRASSDAAAVVAHLEGDAAQDPREDPDYLGWLRDPPSARDQGLSQTKGGQTPAFGAITGVCT